MNTKISPIIKCLPYNINCLQVCTPVYQVPAAMSCVAKTPRPPVQGAFLMQKYEAGDNERLSRRTETMLLSVSSSTAQRQRAAASMLYLSDSATTNAAWPFNLMVLREWSQTTVPDLGAVISKFILLSALSRQLTIWMSFTARHWRYIVIDDVTGSWWIFGANIDFNFGDLEN